MKLENNELNSSEVEWISLMISGLDSKLKSILIEQLNNSEISREYTDFYAFVKFKVQDCCVEISTKKRVPLEMRVFHSEGAPSQFLLHVIDGYIYELEIFNADSSLLNLSMNLENIEIIVDF